MFKKLPTLSSSLLMWTFSDSTSLISIKKQTKQNNNWHVNSSSLAAHATVRTPSLPVYCSWPEFDWLSPGLLWMPAGSLPVPPPGTWFLLQNAENCTRRTQTNIRAVNLHCARFCSGVVTCIVFKRSVEMLTCQYKHQYKARLCVVISLSAEHTQKRTKTNMLIVYS